MAEGPVLLGHLDDVDEHVLGPQAWALAQQLRGARKQCLFLLQAARVVGGDLDEHHVVAAGHAQVRGAVAEVGGVVLGDGHELVVLGHVEGLAQGAVQRVKDRLPVGRRLAGAHGNVDEGHRKILSEQDAGEILSI